jgi:uncharacterized membrane protein
MKTTTTLLLIALSAHANAGEQVRFELLPGMYPLDMSADGSVIVGNDIAFETVRWTRSTGIENLGRGTFGPLGIGAGTPDVSDDGTRISATILMDNGALATQGVWTEGQGWEELMPPPPADGGLIDLSYGSAWGLSGNGEHVVGLYWRPNNFATGGAHASIASMPGGVMDIGTDNGNSRANHANFDASVIVGWEERFDGVWEPVVWEDGVMSRLGNSNVFSMADCVNPEGTIIGGNITSNFGSDFAFAMASLWRKVGSGWQHEFIGALPGTVAPFGLSTVRSMTPDASIVVGYNQTNLQSVTGFIWTPSEGIMDIEDWLTDRGVTIPANLNILDVTAISQDGTIIAGIGASTFDGSPIGFLISPLCVADIDGNGTLNFFDVSAFLQGYNAQDPITDINGDGEFNFFDVSAFLSAYNAGCP